MKGPQKKQFPLGFKPDFVVRWANVKGPASWCSGIKFHMDSGQRVVTLSQTHIASAYWNRSIRHEVPRVHFTFPSRF